MPNPLPTLRGTSAQALYPFTRKVVFNTNVQVFFNGKEQRSANNPTGPLCLLTLPMTNLKGVDKASWLAFFATVKGRGVTDISITLGGVTYNNLALLSDVLGQTNTQTQLYDQVVELRQVINSGWSPTTPITSFPNLSFGAKAEQPFVQSSVFQTSVNDNPMGPRFLYSYFANAIPGFPTGPLNEWSIQYELLRDADVTTLSNLFISHQGRWGTFSFTDPISGTTYNNVRFDQDVLEFTYRTVNQVSTSIKLKETFV